MNEQEEKAEVRAREIAEIRAANASLLAELAEHGFHYAGICELRVHGGRYTAAVPILTKWLPLVLNWDAKESIVRALSVPFAKSAAPVLIQEFRRAPAEQMLFKWTIGNALSIVADDSAFEDVAGLVRDPRHGKAREMLAVALGNMRKNAAAAIEVLLGLLADEAVAGHAVIALGQLRAGSAQPAIEALLRKNPRRWVRKEAEKALKRIGSG